MKEKYNTYIPMSTLLALDNKGHFEFLRRWIQIVAFTYLLDHLHIYWSLLFIYLFFLEHLSLQMHFGKFQFKIIFSKWEIHG